MKSNGGHVMNFAQAALTPHETWGGADVGWQHGQPAVVWHPVSAPRAGELEVEDWTDIERLGQVAARQRRAMVRDVVAAIAFAALAIATAVALLYV